MNQVNPNEAPEGYVAVYSPEGLCGEGEDFCKCAFFRADCSHITCSKDDRQDEQHVFFIKKEKPHD